MFDAATKGTIPPNVGLVWSASGVDVELQRQAQRAWLRMRSYVEAMSHDDLEDYLPGQPYLVAIERSDEVIEQLVEAGKVERLDGARLLLAPEIGDEDVEDLRGSDAYQGSVGVTPDGWYDSVCAGTGLIRYIVDDEDATLFVRVGAANGPNPRVDHFSKACRRRIGSIDADFEADESIRIFLGPTSDAEPHPEDSRPQEVAGVIELEFDDADSMLSLPSDADDDSAPKVVSEPTDVRLEAALKAAPAEARLEEPKVEPTEVGLEEPKVEPTEVGLKEPRVDPTAVGLTERKAEPIEAGLGKPKVEPMAPIALSALDEPSEAHSLPRPFPSNADAERAHRRSLMTLGIVAAAVLVVVLIWVVVLFGLPKG